MKTLILSTSFLFTALAMANDCPLLDPSLDGGIYFCKVDSKKDKVSIINTTDRPIPLYGFKLWNQESFLRGKSSEEVVTHGIIAQNTPLAKNKTNYIIGPNEIYVHDLKTRNFISKNGDTLYLSILTNLPEKPKVALYEMEIGGRDYDIFDFVTLVNNSKTQTIPDDLKCDYASQTDLEFSICNVNQKSGFVTIINNTFDEANMTDFVIRGTFDKIGFNRKKESYFSGFLLDGEMVKTKVDFKLEDKDLIKIEVLRYIGIEEDPSDYSEADLVPVQEINLKIED